MEDFKINWDESSAEPMKEMDESNFESHCRDNVFFHELGHFLAFKFLEEKGLKKSEAMNIEMMNPETPNNWGRVNSIFLEELEFPGYAVVLLSGVLFEVLFCPQELGDMKDFEALFWKQSSMGKDKNGDLVPAGDEARFAASLGKVNVNNDPDLYNKILSAVNEFVLKVHKSNRPKLELFHKNFKERTMEYSKENEFHIIDEDQLWLDVEMKEFIHGVFEELLEVINALLPDK